jgi:dipeptidyl aminopeptidase/acylaminoacyl peptidase
MRLTARLERDKETMPEPAPDFTPYLNVRSASTPSWSPDGASLAFLTDISGVSEAWRTRVASERDGSSETTPAWPDQLTFGGERVSAAVFAPEDERIVLASDQGGSELTQLLLLPREGGALQPLTSAPNAIAQFADWSPDSQRLLYASNTRDPRYFDIIERDLATGEVHQWPLPEGTNWAVRYSPDGQSILTMRVETLFRDRLYLIDRASGTARPITREINARHGSHHAAAWAADGRSLYTLTDEGRDFSNLALLDLTAGNLRYLTDEAADYDGMAVSRDGRLLALTANVEGYSRLDVYDVSGGWDTRKALPFSDPGRSVISEPRWSRDGRKLAFTRESSTAPRDVWVWDAERDELAQATRSATGGLPRATFVEPALVRYPTFDGREIPAFLYTPAGREPRDLPTIVYVHGGPESQFRPIFNPIIQYFVACGYAVLAPNVRGSSGYGHTYMALDDVRLRMDSVADLQHAALWLVSEGVADPKRVAVMGGSYGGFMVLAALTTYPDLWAAGVDIVGVANFVTFLERTSAWRRGLREAEYGSLEHDRDFLESISPLHKADRITAPLFVVHGANDPRVPVEEAEQIVSALRARDVPVEYLRYDDEGHGLIKRANRLAAYPAIARFLRVALGL